MEGLLLEFSGFSVLAADKISGSRFTYLNSDFKGVTVSVVKRIRGGDTGATCLEGRGGGEMPFIASKSATHSYDVVHFSWLLSTRQGLS